MKVMQSLCFASILAFSSAFTMAAEPQNFSSAKITQNDQMSAQQELIELFFAAAKTGNDEVINEFLTHGFPVDVRNASGFTPLMMATYYGQQSIVTTLLAHGADRCTRDNKGNTALMGAMFKMEWAIAKQLRQVDCDAHAQQTGQKTAEQFAREFGQLEKYQQLLKK